MNNIQYLISKPYRKNRRKAVSPVISTIIIVAIAIAISIAVALYLTGITGQFTRFERLDVTSAYANPIVAGVSTIDIDVKNSGTSVLSIDKMLVNGKPTSVTGSWTTSGTASGTTPSDTTLSLPKDGSATIGIGQGDSGTISIGIPGQSGQSIELTLHTVSGKEYPKVVLLP